MRRKEYRRLTGPETGRIKQRIREWLAAPSLASITAEFGVSHNTVYRLRDLVVAERKRCR